MTQHYLRQQSLLQPEMQIHCVTVETYLCCCRLIFVALYFCALRIQTCSLKLNCVALPSLNL